MDDDWEKYSAEHAQFYEGSVPVMLQELLASRDWRVFLDVGCGDGALLFALERSGRLRDKEVRAVDISEGRVAAARKVNKDFRCSVDDACRLVSVEDGSVDVLASLQVVEHVPNDEEMVEQLHRVLGPGGLAYVTTVFKRPGARYIYRNTKGESVIDPTHVREYKDDQLLRMFERHGFEIVEEKKSRLVKPILGFFILGRLGADKDLLTKSSLLKALRRLKYPVPGYYYWEIVARKKAMP